LTNNWKVWVDTSNFERTRKIAIRLPRGFGKRAEFISSFETKEVAEFGIMPWMMEETPEQWEDGIDFLQAMLDAAWEQGLRPKNNKDFDKETQHLEDLRTLLNLGGNTSKKVEIER
jgi:hypothetical protein